MRAMATTLLMVLTSAAFAGSVGVSADTYLCSADTRCFSDSGCEAFDTRMYITRQTEQGRIEMRWPERSSPNVLHYPLVANDPEVEMAGFLPSREDGFGAATFQLYPDMDFLRTGTSHGDFNGEIRSVSVTVQGSCTRIED